MIGFQAQLRLRIVAALIPATWFGPRPDSEYVPVTSSLRSVYLSVSRSRKRKDRSPSPVIATDGGGQSTDTAGAHKKLRATTGPGSPPEEVEDGAVGRQDRYLHRLRRHIDA